MIADIQRFSLHDGPGIRTTVFFKGCTLRCAWCHNPESLSPKAQLLTYPDKCIGCGYCVPACSYGARAIADGVLRYDRGACVDCGACADVCYTDALMFSGKEMDAEAIMAEVKKDAAYYARSGGGITLSGGEALMHSALCRELLERARAEGYHAAVETCLNVPWQSIEMVLDSLDLALVDVKLLDDAAHMKWTGASNRLILENLDRLQKTGVPLIVRTPVIPGVNDDEETISAIAAHIAPFERLMYYELLNFNPLGDGKYRALGMENPFAGAKPLSAERMDQLRRAARAHGIEVRVG